MLGVQEEDLVEGGPMRPGDFYEGPQSPEPPYTVCLCVVGMLCTLGLGILILVSAGLEEGWL